MPHLTHDIPNRLITVLTKTFSMFMLVSIFCILQYMFDMEFICSCIEGLHPNGVLYIFLPPVILAWLVTVTEPIHRKRIFSSCCSQGTLNSTLCRLGYFILDYFGLVVVWFSTVLFDGDWYVCLRTNLNASQTGIPCRTNLTYEESQIKASYKTSSLDYGLIAISSLLLLWVIGDFISDCCNRSKPCSSLCLCNPKPHYKVVYENLLEEQVNSYLNDELLKIAKERAPAICDPVLETIREGELRPNINRGVENVDREPALEPWWEISDYNFYQTDLKPRVEGVTSQNNPSRQTSRFVINEFSFEMYTQPE